MSTVTKAKVTKAKVTKAKVTKAKVTKAKVTKAKVTKAKVTPQAKFIRKLVNFNGDARLYEITGGKLAKHKHVVVSAIVAMFSGAETYIFPSDSKGEVTDWGELEGSYRGGLSHARALRNAGYKVPK